MMLRGRRLTMILAVCIALMVIVPLALAYSVTHTRSTSDPKTHEYKLVVGPNDPPVKDFHLRVREGSRKKLKGAPDGPYGNQGGYGNQDLGWTTSASSNGKEMHWRCGSKPAIQPDETVVFKVTGSNPKLGSQVDIFITTDGGEEIPAGATPYNTGPVVGPCACVDWAPEGTETVAVAAASVTPLDLVCTDLGAPFEVFCAAAVAEEGEPVTDPLGIGINTGVPVPPGWGVVLDPPSGVFDGPLDEDELVHAVMNVHVGGAPPGSEFFVVVVTRQDEEIFTWTQVLRVQVQ